MDFFPTSLTEKVTRAPGPTISVFPVGRWRVLKKMSSEIC